MVSSTVKDLTAGSGLQLEDAGEHDLKGVGDRWHLYRVLPVASLPGAELTDDPPADESRASMLARSCCSSSCSEQVERLELADRPACLNTRSRSRVGQYLGRIGSSQRMPVSA